jgi:hypothetical protein
VLKSIIHFTKSKESIEIPPAQKIMDGRIVPTRAKQERI